MAQPTLCPSRKAACDACPAPSSPSAPQRPSSLVTHGLELFYGGHLMTSASHQSWATPFLLPNKEAEPQSSVCCLLLGSEEEKETGVMFE